MCAVIQAAGDQLVALRSGWLSVSQRFPTDGTQRRSFCGFDIVLWKPSWAARHGCEIQVAAGSTALDGRLGAIQRYDACAEPLGAMYIVTTSPTYPPALLLPPSLPPPLVRLYRRTESYAVAEGQSARSTAPRILDTRRLQISSLLADHVVSWSFTTEEGAGFSQSLSGCNGTSALTGVLTVVYTESFDTSLLNRLPQNFSVDEVPVDVCGVTIEEDVPSPPALPPPLPPAEPNTVDMLLIVLLCIATSGCVGACFFCFVLARRYKEDSPETVGLLKAKVRYATRKPPKKKENTWFRLFKMVVSSPAGTQPTRGGLRWQS